MVVGWISFPLTGGKQYNQDLKWKTVTVKTTDREQMESDSKGRVITVNDSYFINIYIFDDKLEQNTQWHTLLTREKALTVKCSYLHWSSWVIVWGNKEKIWRNEDQEIKYSQGGFEVTFSCERHMMLILTFLRFAVFQLCYMCRLLWNESAA